MTPRLDDGDVRVYAGDCCEVMRELPADSVDAVVCDPPYDLTAGKRGGTGEASVNLDSPYGRSRISTGNGGFMGKDWDATGVAFDPATWREALRVLKPGGHLLAFGGTRTYHRMACAIEDAGFEIRDSLHWLYGSGFPKSLDVSKAIDREAGAEREPDDYTGANYKNDVYGHGMGGDVTLARGAPATHEAAAWQGWGTALKPATEIICMARKPLRERTVARQVLATGTGALNIDATRVEGAPDPKSAVDTAGGRIGQKAANIAAVNAGLIEPPSGRFPPNLLLTHDAACEPAGTRRIKGITGGTGNHAGSVYGARTNEGQPVKDYADADGMETVEAWNCAPGCPVAELDRQSGTLTSGVLPAGTRPIDKRNTFGQDVASGYETTRDFGGDAGGASRFFPTFRYEAKAGGAERDGATHPTVKPLALMRWLCRLVTPPGGLVLDPFAGSGTTGLAARQEGFRAILIEREEEYLVMCAHRLRQLSLFA